jgi:hypothetical protein
MTVGFQCASCGKWHDELPLDLGYAEPLYVAELDDNERQQFVTTLGDFRVLRRDGETSYFVRGVIELPIIGMNEVFRYGVWASLGDESFELAREAYANDVAAGPFFGWVSNRIEGYVDTMNLKSHVHVRAVMRPRIELEPTDHPLAIEQRDGITLDRVREIMHRALHASA